MKQAASENSLAQVQEYWLLVWNFKWWILVSTVVLSLASIVVIALLPDYYQATTTILVDPQKVSERYVSSTVISNPSERLNTLSFEVLSATRLQAIIDEFQLYPELRGSRSRDEIIENMRENIKPQVKEGSSAGLSAFTITYVTRNRNVVAEVANKLASSFIEKNLQGRQQQASETTTFLARHLEDAKNDLEQQESRLREFRMSHLGEMPDQLQGNLQALAGLHITLQANADSQDRLEQERLLLSRFPESEVKPG